MHTSPGCCSQQCRTFPITAITALQSKVVPRYKRVRVTFGAGVEITLEDCMCRMLNPGLHIAHTVLQGLIAQPRWCW